MILFLRMPCAYYISSHCFFFYFCPIHYSHGRCLIVACTRFASAICCSVLGLQGAALQEKCPPPPPLSSKIQQDNFLVCDTTAAGIKFNIIAPLHRNQSGQNILMLLYIGVEQSILHNVTGTRAKLKYSVIYTHKALS